MYSGVLPYSQLVYRLPQFFAAILVTQVNNYCTYNIPGTSNKVHSRTRFLPEFILLPAVCRTAACSTAVLLPAVLLPYSRFWRIIAAASLFTTKYV